MGVASGQPITKGPSSLSPGGTDALPSVVAGSLMLPAE